MRCRPTVANILVVVVVVAVVMPFVAACSGGDATPTTPPPTAMAVPTTDDSLPPAAGSSPTTAPEPAPELSPIVAVSVAVPAVDLSADLAIDLSELAPDELDPFGLFASCSGLQPFIANYNVTVSDPSAGSSAGGSEAVTAIMASSVEPITEPGTYEADVRVERATGGAIDGAGTMTIDEGLASGTFLAFDVLGNEVSGEFRCEGPGDVPTPLPAGADDGTLETVEVVALTRRDDAERVVEIATTAAAADTDCAGATDQTDDLIVRVDTITGSLTTFELNGGAAPSMRMRVGGTTFEFANITTDAEPGDVSGTFSGESSDGLTVDGAFRCT